MNNLPLRVLGDRVLIKPDVKHHAPEQTDAGIFTAKTLSAALTGQDVADWYDCGVIVALGDADAPFDVRQFVRRRLRKLECQAHEAPLQSPAIAELVTELDTLPERKVRGFNLGDRVTFSWEAGQQVTIDGDVYLVLPEREVLAVIETRSQRHE